MPYSTNTRNKRLQHAGLRFKSQSIFLRCAHFSTMRTFFRLKSADFSHRLMPIYIYFALKMRQPPYTFVYQRLIVLSLETGCATNDLIWYRYFMWLHCQCYDMLAGSHTLASQWIGSSDKNRRKCAVGERGCRLYHFCFSSIYINRFQERVFEF